MIPKKKREDMLLAMVLLLDCIKDDMADAIPCWPARKRTLLNDAREHVAAAQEYLTEAL